MDKQYTVVQNIKQLQELKNHIDSNEIIALDTETTSLNPRSGKIIGWSVSAKTGIGYYLPTLIYNSDTKELEPQFIQGTDTHYISIKFMEILKNKKLILHNASFDVQYIEKYFGVDLLPSVYVDTILLVHTVNEAGVGAIGGQFALKALAIHHAKELDLDTGNQEQLDLKESIHANGGSTSKSNFEIYKADLQILGTYAAADTDLTLRIYQLYLPKLQKEKLEKFFFDDEVMPIFKEVTVPMEKVGVDLDMDLLRQTKEEVEKDSKSYKEYVHKQLEELPEFKQWVEETKSRLYPPKKTGKFVQTLLEIVKEKHCLPKSQKTGRYSTSKTNVEKNISDIFLKNFLQTGDVVELDPQLISDIQTKLWKESNDGSLFNIQSKKQLKEIVFDYLKEEPLTTNETTGDPKFDQEYIKHIAPKYKWAESLRRYNKLLKIKSAYIDRFLDNQENGRFYFYFKQHGTVSGRYGSNAQQLPKPFEDGDEREPKNIRKYINNIRAFFIAGEGYKVIDSDYESLEPHCFASITGDKKLQDIFNLGHDFYSTVAIATEKIHGVSADKRAENYLGKVDKVRRNKAKAYSLGIAYGMEAFALAKTLDIDQKAAEKLVNGYLNGFPGLKKWREDSRRFVKEHGFIRNKVGRIRHLPVVKTVFSNVGDNLMNSNFRQGLMKQIPAKFDSKGKEVSPVEQVNKLYRDYRNGLNNCLNYQLQSLAAAVVNRAALQINRAAKKMGIDAIVQAQIHDQLVIRCEESRAEEFSEVVQDLMENTTKLQGVTLKAPPEIGNNWKETH